MLSTWGSLRGWWETAPCAGYIDTPVDATTTVPAGEAYCSFSPVEVDSVAVGDGVVVVDGVWRIYGGVLLDTPVDSTILVADAPAYSVGAIEIDSVAAGVGIVEINGAWRLS